MPRPATALSGFQSRNEDGLLVAANDWDGKMVPEKVLTDGKVQVHFK